MDLNYNEPLYRPPSEANSLILQVTIGCSHNKCLFCEMYKTKKFKTRPVEDIEQDIKTAAKIWPDPEKIFLADGDSLVLPAAKLKKICEAIYNYFPHKPRISAYASPQNILVKSTNDLKTIRTAGISLLYYGVESGNDTILKKISKGATALKIKEGLSKAHLAGFDMSATWILGLGGKKYSKDHARDTARILSTAGPKYTSALTLIFTDTSDHFRLKFPEWIELSAVETLEELKSFVELYDGKPTIFRSNHASNYLSIKGTLPADKDRIVKLLQQAIDNPLQAIRPEWSRGL